MRISQDPVFLSSSRLWELPFFNQAAGNGTFFDKSAKKGTFLPFFALFRVFFLFFRRNFDENPKSGFFGEVQNPGFGPPKTGFWDPKNLDFGTQNRVFRGQWALDNKTLRVLLGSVPSEPIRNPSGCTQGHRMIAPLALNRAWFRLDCYRLRPHRPHR